MKQEPKKEDYGWQDATLYGGESDWMLEGGEEEYYKALAEYRGEPLQETPPLEWRDCASCGYSWLPGMFQLDSPHCRYCMNAFRRVAGDELPF